MGTHLFGSPCIFTNLCFHEADFSLESEWNFFATSHDKSACDGIGGTVKRFVTKASLQLHPVHHIVKIESMFDWCWQNILGIHFFLVKVKEVSVSENELQNRFESAQTVQGILPFYFRFIVNIKAFKITLQFAPPKLVHIFNGDPNISDNLMMRRCMFYF